MRQSRFIPLFLSISLMNLCWAQNAALPDPEKPGPYPVGVTTMQLADPARTEVFPEGPRKLLTEIWYPAADAAKDMPKKGLIDTYMSNIPKPFFGILTTIVSVDLQKFDSIFQFFAFRDAPIRDGVFPLLVFSHGSVAARIQNIFWCEHMASHGYVVMAPDHTGNAIITFVDGKPVTVDGKIPQEKMATKRVGDVRFLIDQMDAMNKDAASLFAGHVDMDRIGVSGHSFGGFTAAAAADADPRIKAIAPMAGLYVERTNFTCPVMALVASEDKIITKMLQEKPDLYKDMRQYCAESQGPHYLVEFLNAGHFSFTEVHQCVPDFGDGVGQGKRVTNGEPLDFTPMAVIYPLIDGYTTAFFGRYLKNETGYDAYLQSNRNPQEIRIETGSNTAGS
ncbi:MAG: hypothetical protein QG656_270 [Candidatus Hydrogenedentes bacterium]|nr:hypothetical protein [Candidatus Hydrogenedentota bacterium]